MTQWIEEQITRHGRALIFRNGQQYKVTLSPRGKIMIESKRSVHPVNELRVVMSVISREGDAFPSRVR